MVLADATWDQLPPDVLHICSDYSKQRLYGELVAHLAKRDVRQFVYVPVRSPAELDANRLPQQENIEYRFSQVLRPYHRLFFRTKIRTIVDDLLRHADLKKCSLLHAHFLYSDGAVARRLQRATGLPYITAVRNTDLNWFMRLRPDLRWICWDILRNASKVVFLTPAYLETVVRNAPREFRKALELKSEIVPNGIDGFWLQADNVQNRAVGVPLRILYVGDFSRNKNILGAIHATRIVNAKVPSTLTLVGEGGDGEREVDALLASGRAPFVKRLGRVDDRVALRQLYRSHDLFLMPSFRETFGLAYIEALSQGLPVVHSVGQGIDGYFDSNTVTAPVIPFSESEIAEGIIRVAKRLPSVRGQCVLAAQQFAWPVVVRTYERIYRETVFEHKRFVS